MSGFEVVTVVRCLAKKEHSAALAQLASRTSAIMKFGAGAGVDPFVRVNGLFTDLINRMQAEASSEASHNLHCDEETMLGSNLSNSKRPWPDPPFLTALDRAQTEPDVARPIPRAPDFSWYTVTFDGLAHTRRSIPNLDEASMPSPGKHRPPTGGKEALEIVFCLSELHQLHCTQEY